MASNAGANDDEELLRALPEIDSALGSGQSAAESSAIDPCAVYQKLKPYLPMLIKAASKIPIVGSRIAQALTILQQLGERCCK